MVVNSRIDGRYEIKETLGQGGMGIVYRAYDTQRKGYVALKTMKDAADPAALELFAQEWRTLANISHPNIVDVLNSGEFEEGGLRKPYFVMPLLPGKTLDKLIRDTGHKLTVDRVVEIFYQTCRGLQAAHINGLIHRDLKPSNLFVLNDDSVKVIDFGMVHLTDVTKSATGIKGTLQYMAPEQLEMKEITAATDIFSLGVVIYEALTGRQPFDRGSPGATAQAIRTEFPPAVSELNPAVNKTLAQVISKAMAKGPWNRFASAKEFGEHLQRAIKGESIEAFELARIQPRIERAKRALHEGDYEYAGEILNELQLEGHVDSEITVLLDQVKEANSSKVVRQLLDSARTRLQEEEYPLAWQKVQEALQRDPANGEAQALQAEIETRRSDQQIEKWRQLVHQHLHNNAFVQARQAIEEISKLRRDDVEVGELVQSVERRESEFRSASADKEQHFQSAMRAYGTGEISTALSKLGRILELDGRAPGFTLPGRDQVYREAYNKIRSEWEDVQHAVAEIEKLVAAGDLTKASALAGEQSNKYPSDFGLRALKLKVEDLQRQEKSAYIAEVGRHLDREPDLDRGVQLLEEALERYPQEPHFQELASSLRQRRDFVNSIVARARQCEEQNLMTEALSQWNTLRSVNPHYPGLEFEIERVQKRCEQYRLEDTRLGRVNQIDRLLQSSEFDKAQAMAVEALLEFPVDKELQTLERLSQEGRQRRSEAEALSQQAKDLCSQQRFGEAIEVLRRALALDANNSDVRTGLADALAAQAERLQATDWRSAEPLIQEALHTVPTHTLAKSLRSSISLARRLEFVSQCVAQAREMQAAGDLEAALAKVQEGLGSYPNDTRLVQLQTTLRNSLAEQVNIRRKRDLEELKQLSKDVEEIHDPNNLTALFERSLFLSRAYPEDPQFSTIASKIQRRARSTEPGRSKDTRVIQAAADLPKPVDKKPIEPKTERKSLAALYSGSWLGRRPLGAQVGLGLLPLLLVGVVAFVVSRPKQAEPPARLVVVPVTFATDPPGATLSVSGKAVSGNSESFAPGTYRAMATKLGYKPNSGQFTVGKEPAKLPVTVRLEPEPSVIRVLADLKVAKAFVDGQDSGPLQDGNFSLNIVGAGPHQLKLVDGRNVILLVDFETSVGAPIKLSHAPVARDIPVVAVSIFGSRALVKASVPGLQASLNGGDAQAIPSDGREITMPNPTNELVVTDGNRPTNITLESSNGPVLMVRAGTISKGLIRIESLDGASVWVNGKRNSRLVQNGKWVGQYDPGDYMIRVTLGGYDDETERKVTLAAGKTAAERFDLRRSVTTAFLRVEGGTPGAEVLVDGILVERLDASGSLGPLPVAPGEHSIRFRKENFEPSSEYKKSGAARQEIAISGAEARLKQFGSLVFEVQPPEAQITVRRGGVDRRVTERTLQVAEGSYTVVATADPNYERSEVNVQVTSGRPTTVQVTLRRKPDQRPKVPDPVITLPELFREDPKNWTVTKDGYYFSEKAAALKQIHFSHTFDILKNKGALGKVEKTHLKIHTQGNDFIEVELDGNKLAWGEASGLGHPKDWTKLPHGSGSEAFFRLKIKVEPKHISLVVGKAEASIDATVEGHTEFIGKVRLKLVQ